MTKEDLIDITLGFARFALKNGGLAPTFVAARPHPDGTMMIAAPWRDDSEKDRILDAMRATFALHEVEAYCLVSEVWMSKNMDYRHSPKDDPERLEAVSLLYVDKDTAEMHQYELIRCNDGAVILGDAKIHKGIEGRMAELLPPPELPPVPRELRPRFQELIHEHYGIGQFVVD